MQESFCTNTVQSGLAVTLQHGTHQGDALQLIGGDDKAPWIDSNIFIHRIMLCDGAARQQAGAIRLSQAANCISAVFYRYLPSFNIMRSAHHNTEAILFQYVVYLGIPGIQSFLYSPGDNLCS